MKTQKKWTMPAWMEPYRETIVNTGGNSIEDMMNGKDSPLINLPLSTLQACVKSQVALLSLLHKDGCLNPFASDMLAALKAFVDPWNKGGNWQAKINYDTFSRARDTIAKATGVVR